MPAVSKKVDIFHLGSETRFSRNTSLKITLLLKHEYLSRRQPPMVECRWIPTRVRVSMKAFGKKEYTLTDLSRDQYITFKCRISILFPITLEGWADRWLISLTAWLHFDPRQLFWWSRCCREPDIKICSRMIVPVDLSFNLPKLWRRHNIRASPDVRLGF